MTERLINLPIAVVDAFVTEKPFSGNPAGVVLTDAPLEEPLMQAIAAQMNLSETAFLVPQADGYLIRYFTPTIEVALCGHATLGSAHWLFETQRVKGEALTLVTGAAVGGGAVLTVRRLPDGRLAMDLPPDPVTPAEAPTGLVQALGAEVIDAVRGETDWLLRFKDEATVAGLSPDMMVLKDYPRLIIATAPADVESSASDLPGVPGVGVVCRCFAIASGIPEDPVTGSAHRTLAAYWSPQVGDRFVSRQLSKRGGLLVVESVPDGVRVAGLALLRLEGRIHLS